MAKTYIDPEVLKRGRVEGEIEGKIKGKIEGRTEGKLEVARNLLSLGVSVEIIQQAANLTAEQLAELEKQSGQA